MNPISLKQFHICETNNNVVYKKINCKHWSVKDDSCSQHCTLKNIECGHKVCSSCAEREPIQISPPPKNPRTHPFINEMKEKLPQYNVYKPQTPSEESVNEKSFVEKAKSYASAETSQMVQGKVSKKVFEKRKNICMSCEYRVPIAKEKKDEIGWCKGGCGCTVGNPRAALSQKLYMPTLSCPKGKFGPDTGEGFSISDAVDSVKGIITSVKNLFEKDK